MGTSKKICFYHGADLDGKCSGAIFRFVHETILKQKNIELIPFNYGDDIDLNRIEGCDIFFVDCNPQPFEKWLETLLNRVNSLTIIDHHKSLLENQTYLKAVEDGRIFSYSRIGLGACALIWEYFFEVLKVEHFSPMPEVVQLLAKYDAWCNEDKQEWEQDILPFQYGIRLKNLDPREDFKSWERLLYGHHIDKYIEKGKAILAYERNRLAGLSKHCSFEATIKGRKAICINSDSKSSMTLESLFNPEKHDVMCVFSMGLKDNVLKYFISFYTTIERVDCSALAKEFGGGGHKGAAGCMVTSLHFDGSELVLIC